MPFSLPNAFWIKPADMSGNFAAGWQAAAEDTRYRQAKKRQEERDKKEDERWNAQNERMIEKDALDAMESGIDRNIRERQIGVIESRESRIEDAEKRDRDAMDEVNKATETVFDGIAAAQGIDKASIPAETRLKTYREVLASRYSKFSPPTALKILEDDAQANGRMRGTITGEMANWKAGEELRALARQARESGDASTADRFEAGAEAIQRSIGRTSQSPVTVTTGPEDNRVTTRFPSQADYEKSKADKVSEANKKILDQLDELEKKGVKAASVDEKTGVVTEAAWYKPDEDINVLRSRYGGSKSTPAKDKTVIPVKRDSSGKLFIPK